MNGEGQVGFEIGTIVEVDLRSKAFAHLEREWIVHLKILGTYETRSRFEGRMQSVYFALLDPVFDKRPADFARPAFGRSIERDVVRLVLPHCGKRRIDA